MSDFQQTITSLNLLHTSLYRMELFQNAHAVKNVKTDVISLISGLEAVERERDELKQRLANAEHQLHMAELAKFNLRNQRKAQFRKRREAEAELARRDAAASELPSAELSRLREWVKCVEAERDKAISWHSSLLKKFDNFQGELARHDAAAVAVISEDSLAELKQSYRPVLAFRPDHKRNSPGISLYTAALPADSIPDGYCFRLIPAEGTDAFRAACTVAFEEFNRGTGPCGVFIAGHRAMLSAAPAPGGDDDA